MKSEIKCNNATIIKDKPDCISGVVVQGIIILLSSHCSHIAKKEIDRVAGAGLLALQTSSDRECRTTSDTQDHQGKVIVQVPHLPTIICNISLISRVTAEPSGRNSFHLHRIRTPSWAHNTDNPQLHHLIIASFTLPKRNVHNAQ